MKKLTKPCYRCGGTGQIPRHAAERVLGELTRTAWRTHAEVAAMLSRESSHVASVLRQLYSQGFIERRGRGVRGAPYEWRLP
jgi:predicted transcriptional regulator